MRMWTCLWVALGLAFASSASYTQTSAEDVRRPMHSPGGDQVPADPEPGAASGTRPYADPDPLPASGGPQSRIEGGAGDHSRVPMATGSGPAMPPPASMPARQPRAENGYTWICGGVGTDEAKQMKQLARQHDLMLTFAASDGSFLADIDVEIADTRSKQALKLTCDGPIMLVDFPRPGTYRIHASSAGRPMSTTVQVQGKDRGKTIELVWPAQ